MRWWFSLWWVAGLGWAQAPLDGAFAEPGVDWREQVVRVSALGAPDVRAANAAQARLGAERAAQSDGPKKLLALTRTIPVEGARRLGELMEKDDALRAKVEAAVKGAPVSRKRYFSDNGVALELALPLVTLSDLLGPEPPPTTSATEGEAAGKHGVTGLVVDARRLKLVPALLPRLVDEAGKVLYGVDSLSPEARKLTAVAVYFRSLEAATRSVKAGDRPLVVKAVKAGGTDVQLSREDAKRLGGIDVGVLRDGRVVIVVD